MDNESKRQLLAEVLAGNLERLRALKVNNQANELNIRWVIDNRQSGGSIDVQYRDGNKGAMTPEAFAELPAGVTVWTMQDHTGGRPVPEPDESYHERLHSI